VLVPLHVTFRGLSPSTALETHVRRRAAKLDRFFARITACRVVVELAHRHRRHGKQYRVSIDMAVPRSELAVGRAPAEDRDFEDAHAAVDDAFDDAERRLEDWSRRLRDH
jgi:ribosomal subunit interface protein